MALAPLAMVAQGPNVLFVHPGLPYKNVGELVQYAKAHPGTVTFASSGVGTSPHLAAELFANRAGIDIIHVPYRGANPAANDLMGGQVNAFFSVLNLMPHVEQGRLRALAVTSEERISEVPELPTVDEAGKTKGAARRIATHRTAPHCHSPATLWFLCATLCRATCRATTRRTASQLASHITQGADHAVRSDTA